MRYTLQNMSIYPVQKRLYLLLVVLSFFFFLIALGPGLLPNSSSSAFSWQRRFFHVLCHQDPLRSFTLNGQVMAVCARCIGIYGAFFLVMFLMPFLVLFYTVINRVGLQLIVLSIAINFVDIIGNGIDIWTNTLYSRSLIGALFGLFLSLFLTNEFFKREHKTEESYGK